ncbi:gamma-glutamyl-gamma-aminobutyrate hydrolase family protein [Pseudomonas sp. CVAP|uniref:gamma-glutamyl-gamma-aminobutyrate hydrolase family protein n=1 Tax=Pseudomonas sp. CVAP\|nr:gamma-glutamyl-gamma-aminobutyrate hydrolase family protein [Pseudomonas sp. CVAP\
MRPIILISAANQRLAVNHSAALAMTVVNSSYIKILTSLGCTPLIIPPGVGADSITALMSLVNGLVLPSGQDICSSFYGEASQVQYSAGVAGIGEPFNRPLILQPDRDRDVLELALYHEAKSRKLPVLGICRGMQLINVAEGGTLHQEIPYSGVDHCIDPDGWINYHPIEVNAGTRLHGITNRLALSASSVHHQCINRLPVSLRVNATSADGLIEGIELDSDSHFVLGLQGHIEKTLINHPENMDIWNGFVSAVIQRSS